MPKGPRHARLIRRRLGLEHESKQGPDLLVSLDRVAQGALGVELVSVAPAFPDTREIAALLEVGDDPLHGALGDPHSHRDLAKADLRLARNAQQDVPVIAEERPAASAAPFTLAA
jgi:hypothetical protein